MECPVNESVWNYVLMACLWLQALDRAKSDAEKLKKLVHGGSFRRLVCANINQTCI